MLFLLCIKADLENVDSVTLPEGSQYCLTVRGARRSPIHRSHRRRRDACAMITTPASSIAAQLHCVDALPALQVKDFLCGRPKP